MIPLSLYIHFPWCIEKCPYCDFNSHKQNDSGLYDQYMAALLDDVVEILPHIWGRSIRSVFIGGGTPSLIKPEDLERLFSMLRAYLTFVPNGEITLEANPGTVDQAYFKEYFALGVNRLSIGIQSLNAKHLKKLGRIHNVAEAINAVDIAKSTGFTQINCDLMFGLPEQTVAEAMADLAAVIALNPSHISHYQLTLEPNTYFHRYPPVLPQSELIESMQLEAYARLAAAGYEHYEVSAFARKGHACQHNKNYWAYGDYIGIGAGAHGKISKMGEGRIMRTTLEKHPKQYVAQNSRDRLTLVDVTPLERPFEFMLNALRLKQGVPLSLFTERTFMPIETVLPRLYALQKEGLIVMAQERFRASDLGFLFLNRILQAFL